MVSAPIFISLSIIICQLTSLARQQPQKDLFLAICAGDLSQVTLSIEAGADVNVVNDAGISPLCLAIRNGEESIVLKLLEWRMHYYRGGQSVNTDSENCEQESRRSFSKCGDQL